MYIYIYFFFFFPLTDPTSGNSIDYTYDKLGVVHSYCVELRPGEEDRQGFLPLLVKSVKLGEKFWWRLGP